MLTEIIQRDSNRLPIFVEIETAEGLKCMEYIQQCILWIGELDKERFLLDYELDRVRQYIDIYLDRINRIAGTKYFIKSRDWIRFRMMTYMKYSKENELYEQLSNIDKVFKMMF
jgi:hypothetical protein